MPNLICFMLSFMYSVLWKKKCLIITTLPIFPSFQTIVKTRNWDIDLVQHKFSLKKKMEE